MKRVCVFCGSRPGRRPQYAQLAVSLGTELAERGIELVYGGARVGTMGILANATLAAGGRVVGVIPTWMRDRELAHASLTELHDVASMHERKNLMAELSDAFVVLPGGLGTYDELFEMLTWSALDLHRKPCGLLDVLDYFAPLRSAIDRAVDEGFLDGKQRDALIRSESAGELLTRLAEMAR
jgi:hypothetical protein